MEVTIRIPTIRELARHWKWGVLAALVLAFTLAGGARPAFAAESITSPDTVGSVGQFTSLVLDAAGNLVVGYHDSNGHLKVLHCNDANCAGGGESITSPDTVGVVGLHTSLALDAHGNPVISYLAHVGSINYDLKVLHCGDTTCTAGNTIAAIDAVFAVATSLALDANGNPVVSYYNASGNASGSELRVLHCNDANCSGGGDSITTLDGGLGPPTATFFNGSTSLALDASGNPVVSYLDVTNRRLKVLHCNDANCAGGNESITAPDTGGAAESDNSLALDAAGNPVVSYWANGTLSVLHCNDANCAGGGENSTALDTVGGGVGAATSLALDRSGNPVVSYRDSTNADLKVLHCNNANCAGAGQSITTVDSGGDVGLWNSLALDAIGNPVVSYVDSTNQDLKVLHCNDPACSASAKVLPINIANLGQYALPKSCFQVRNPSQIPYFTICDNDFQGTPELDPICLPDGVCGDDDSRGGSIVVPVAPGDYRVVESQAAPNHVRNPSSQSCSGPVGGQLCALTFINSPNTRPWHPWDINNDGVVRTGDITAVVQHFSQDKPLN